MLTVKRSCAGLSLTSHACSLSELYLPPLNALLRPSPSVARAYQQKEELDAEVIAAANGTRKSAPGDGRAATVAPASAVGSRNHSRSGSRIGSRVEERRADELRADKSVSVFYAEGAKNGAAGGHVKSGSVENDGSVFAASRRVDGGEDEAEKRLSSANINQLLGA